MHHSLEIFEIFESIVRLAYADAQTGLKDVASLAATCRAFHEPAVHVLWDTIPGLEPLALCLPDDALRCINLSDSHSVLTLCRSLVDMDLDRCRFYASHVKRLGYNASDETKAAPRKLQLDKAIYGVLKDHHILDKDSLRAYRCAQGEFDVEILRGIIGSGLEAFELTHYPSGYMDYSNVLLSTIPILTHVRIIRLHGSVPFPSSALIPLLKNIKHLEVFTCPRVPLPYEALGLLSALPTLREFQSFNTVSDLIQCLPETEVPFTRLEHLSVHSCRISDCSSLVECIKSLHLRSVEIILHSQRRMLPSDLYNFFNVLRTDCPSELLGSICIRPYDPYTSPSNLSSKQVEDEHILATVLEPLLCFRYLNVLNINVNYPMDLSTHSMDRLRTTYAASRAFH